MRAELVKNFMIHVAHQNPNSTGVGSRLHGHSLNVAVVVTGEVDPGPGWVVDFGVIKDAVRPVLAQLDHRFLNEIDDLADPSPSGVAQWVHARLKPVLPGLSSVHVTISGDTGFSPVELDPDPGLNLPSRIRFSCESAQNLPQLAEDHPCRGLHGHTYWIEVAAVDLARLRPLLRDLYEDLDHRWLNDIPDLGPATSEHICAWIWNRLSETIDDLTAVVVQETPTSRCIYRGE